jgi:hypothetical protein
MPRFACCLTALLFTASPCAAEILTPDQLNDSALLSGKYGAPIALPEAEDAARMQRIGKASELDDNGYGGRVNPGNYGHGLGQGWCVEHPAWRGCGAGDGR